MGRERGCWAIGYCRDLCRLSVRQSVRPTLVTSLQPTIFNGSWSYLVQPLIDLSRSMNFIPYGGSMFIFRDPVAIYIDWLVSWTRPGEESRLDGIFLAATKQLYEWLSPSVCLLHLFHYVPIIVSSQNFQKLLPMTEVMCMQAVKVRGQRSRSQRSKPYLAVSGS